jgi:hypothetical protein
MTIKDLFALYNKEREYQKCCFGEYNNIDSLNLASFLVFIRQYLKKAEKGYAGKWEQDLPSWLVSSKEMKEGSAPFEAYEELIKVFVLAGAALETFANINPEEWRKDLTSESRKWRE